MLEAITDFWKPIKKAPAQTKTKLADLQIGSVVSFGYVPQAILSGRKLTVTAVNSYQFGADVLTSFAINREKDHHTTTDISMIVADAQGGQYLAISRKLSRAERAKLFAENSIENVIGKTDATKLTCLDNVPELKGWLVSGYKREIKGMRGFIHKTDLRSGSDKLHAGEEFQYTLLGSDSSEHALEIEVYQSGQADERIEVYATIYRRTSDITEVLDSQSEHQKANVTLVTQNNEASPVAKALLSPITNPVHLEPVIVNTEKAVLPEIVSIKSEIIEKKPEIIKLEELPLPQLTATPLVAEIEKTEIIEPIKLLEESAEMTMTPILTNENKSFGSNGHDYNGLATKQEIKADIKTANTMDGGSINCDLKVANQIIEEAIRNEMRLSDVVRRIIELPVAHQESVQIPITLSDDDYSLLAIRYGISASDKNAIKNRIIQDLGDFSGNKRKS